VSAPPLPVKKATADAEQFFALDLRAGTILTAKLNPKARQPAYVLEIDLGPLGTVKSSAQLTVNYTAEALVGRQVVVVANLPPRKIAGVKSEVLVLGTMVAEQGTLLLGPDERAANGAPVG
jgi:tRNA-binding protein